MKNVSACKANSFTDRNQMNRTVYYRNNNTSLLYSNMHIKVGLLVSADTPYFVEALKAKGKNSEKRQLRLDWMCHTFSPYTLIRVTGMPHLP